MTFRLRVYNLRETNTRTGKLVNGAIMLLIIVNILAIIMESVESVSAGYGKVFWLFELFSVAIFTVEYPFKYFLLLCRMSHSGRYRFRCPVERFHKIQFARNLFLIKSLSNLHGKKSGSKKLFRYIWICPHDSSPLLIKGWFYAKVHDVFYV